VLYITQKNNFLKKSQIAIDMCVTLIYNIVEVKIMEAKIKLVKLSSKRNGFGDVSSYTVNLGAAEVKSCGFLDEDGNALPIEKIIDAENGQIVLRAKK